MKMALAKKLKAARKTKRLTIASRKFSKGMIRKERSILENLRYIQP